MDTAHMKLAGAAADRDRWEARDCSIDGALKIVGTRSAMLLMREAHYGTTRFEDFVRRVGITEAVAAARLRELVTAGLLARRAYKNPGERTRHEYVLTEAGGELQLVLMAFIQWGDRHLPRRGGPPLDFRHTGCEEPIAVRLSCAAGHDVEPGAITVRGTWGRPTPATEKATGKAAGKATAEAAADVTADVTAAVAAEGAGKDVSPAG
ncbi:hypothetical protein Misp01_13460 [Microtetraspora sp. NBRC 13810]|uniref:winged helix-turn-helix transcriptional regulator n=1 Tax=Microtetraspora sp. NBRC 13810 TaxID=3030990 RepID=UPI0024A323A0|nr:helix-turn-helix domain-containing protein [Microtetraspora sp. NBRC 13810]GLW06216.1 hypothetical protein Misp01_13460 [Microtetraspora sp. NBRC 13810]